MNNTQQPTSTLNLRNNLRKYGYNNLANAITQTGNEYHKAKMGQLTVEGGMTGAYNRWQTAIEKGRNAMRSLA